ncbi:guanine nucleotide exchange protein smcr8b isoform X2 [Syngnathus scovelli]|uniref:guanine nucleotide exchange protein smcr8b isoform X2 n=1 Tax=Syngnathus scovelli TaxID=161590 RepID=UPI00210F8020|nr:guanine nucleotide exchange protein smcr8b isoform X2 [Syngnathus scovelli]
MISSPDLLPFTGPEGFGDSEDGEAEGERGTARGLLPEELSIPPLPSDASGGGHPWSSAAGFHRDFVLVAEFSEEVGPTPVMTIPDEAGASGSLDLNHFSVRIMSVDYQASGPGGPSSSSSSGLRLNFNEDSEVVLGDSADWVFAYVRHMTLLDLSARGFGLAADSLKTGNRQTFSLELHRKLHQLQYKRLALLQDDSMSGAGEQLEAVERAIATHKDLLRQVTSYPNRKLKQPDFLPYEPADVSTDATSIPPPPPPAAHLAGPEGRLKPLQELCSTYFLSLMTEQLAQAEVRLRGDVTALRSAGITRALNRKLRLTNFLFEQPEDDEEEEEEDGEEAVARETGSWPSSESSVEAKEEEMTGSTSSGDSIQVIGTERSYKTLASSAAPVTSSLLPGSSDPAPIAVPLATPLPSLDSSLVAVSDPGPRRLRVYVGRTNSEDSIEVLSTTESIIAEDLAAISEEEEPIKDDKTDVTAKDARAGSAYQMLPNLPAEPWSWPQSVDEASDGGAETHAPHRTLSSDEAGLRAQRFVKQNSFSRQVVFCLLSGRPLVLLSGDGDKLRKTVDALALFLPAPAGAVMPCLSAPLQLSDLLTWRLIGFHRSPSSGPLHWLSRYSRYLAVLDLDQRTLRCQRYSGSLAGSLVGSAVPAGAFLLHVQSGLTALANRALLFTFARRGDKDDVLDDGDLSVMRFLSDLIKRQHAARGPPALRFSYVALHVHKNTTAV